MLKRTFRINALSLAGGALLLGGVSVAAGAMPLPGSLPGAVTEQPAAAIFTDGDATAKVAQIYWHGHGGGWLGGGWHGHGGGWHGGSWHGGRWCYWHPYACRGY